MKLKEKYKDYYIHCWQCQSYKNLLLIPHRHQISGNKDNLVGILILCEKCFGKYRGKDIDIIIKDN
jgi:hypothetical protein